MASVPRAHLTNRITVSPTKPFSPCLGIAFSGFGDDKRNLSWPTAPFELSCVASNVDESSGGASHGGTGAGGSAIWSARAQSFSTATVFRTVIQPWGTKRGVREGSGGGNWRWLGGVGGAVGLSGFPFLRAIHTISRPVLT